MTAADATRTWIALRAELECAAPCPRRSRFALALAAAVLSCFLFLVGFEYVLRAGLQPRVRTSAIAVRIIEAPPKPAEPARIAPAAPALHPTPAVHHRPAPRPKPRPIAPAPPPESGIEPREAVPGTPYGGPAASRAPAGSSAGEAAGEAGGAGVGFGAAGGGGARAIYAPLPKIPDELRQDAFSTVAIAHFVVGADGKVQVALTTPTSNPGLNLLILETLRQWKFFPAMKDGVAIASQFDLRIPITVR